MRQLVSRWSQIAWFISIVPDGHTSLKQEVFEHHHANCCIKNEPQEMRKRRMGNAIGCPRAMMIHFRYASFADLAMMCPGRFDSNTLLTPPPTTPQSILSLFCLLILTIIDFNNLPRDPSSIGKARSIIAYPYASH